MIVVDNSVLAGFAIATDDYHEGALIARARDNDWHAPELARSEFRSVANGYLRKGESLSAIEAAGFVVDDCATFHSLQHQGVFALLRETRVSAYDAEYVALALQLGCKLVTTESLVLKAFPNVAVRLQDFVKS